MTLTASSEYWTTGIEQVRETLRKIENLELTLKIAPPRLTHTDILAREIQDLNRSLDRVQSVVNLSAQGLLSAIVLGCGAFWAFVEVPLPNMAAAAGIALSAASALWACITFSLRNV